MARSATKKIAYNTGIQVIGRIVTLAIAGVSVAVLTRYLGAEGYGKFTFVLVYLQVFGLVADMGLFTVAVREMSRKPSRVQEIVGNTLALRGVLAVAVFTGALGLSLLLPFEPDVRIGVAIAAFSHLFGLMNSSLISVFQTKLRMEFSVIADLLGRLASFGSVLYVASQDLGFYAVVATAALGSLLTLIVTSILARRYVRIRFYFDTGLWKELLRESLPLGIALVIGQLYFRLDILMLSAMRTNAEVGVYGAVFKILEMLLVLPGFFVNSVFPILVARLAKGPGSVRSTLQKAFDALLIAGFIFPFGGILTAPTVMRIIGGQEFVAGANALRISLFAMALTFASLVISMFFIAKDRQSFVWKAGLFCLIVNAAINALAIPLYGIEGAAVATLVSDTALFLTYLIGSRKVLGTGARVGMKVFPKIMVAGTAMVVAMWLVSGSFAAQLVLGPAVYIGVLLVLRAIDRDVLAELRPV